MTALKCKGDRRLESAVLVMDIKTSTIIKIWYESDEAFDPYNMKDKVITSIKTFLKK